MTYLMVGDHVQWEVFWVAVKGRKKVIIAKDFGNDITAAVDLYMKAKAAKKPFATLRCKNVAFPPPAKYQPRVVIERKKVRKNGKIFIRRTEILVTPMTIVNHRGVVWCPYCREFRRFMLQDGFRHEGIYVPKAGYYCLCGITSENGMVRKHNPNPPMVPQRTRRNNNGGKRTRQRT